MSKVPVFKGGVKVFEIEVDDDVHEELSQSVWYACTMREHGHLYAQRKVKDPKGSFKNQKLHHAVLRLPLNAGVLVDHTDRNTLNCRKDNLRMVSALESCWNRSKTKKPVSSKYIGVCTYRGRWAAAIDRQHIGYFNEEKNAAIAYDYEARKRRGDFAVLNFPEINEKPTPDRKTLTGRKYVTTGMLMDGTLKYRVQISCCVPRILNTRSTLEEAIEFRNQKLKELGVPIPD